ncbi:hypothetical protein MHYP_G00101560 [Metynnis hypsauchen]
MKRSHALNLTPCPAFGVLFTSSGTSRSFPHRTQRPNCQRAPTSPKLTILFLRSSTAPAAMKKSKGYFVAESRVELLEEILNKTFTELPQNVVVDALTKVMNENDNQNNVVHVNNILAATEKLVSALVPHTATYNITPITVPNLGSAAVAFMNYINITNMMDANLFITAENTEKTMMSTVVSATLIKVNNVQFSTPVNFTLKHISVFKPDGKLFCVYWNISEWIVDGCYLLQSNISHSVCSCVHLSTFALIMQTNPGQEDKGGQNNHDSFTKFQRDLSLELLNTVAVAVGLGFLSVTLLTFALCRRNPRVNNTARINLSLNLLLAHFIFLLTQSFLQYIQTNKLACIVLAGVLHFLFLSAFMWMFIEAVLLFISVKNLKKIRSKQKEVLSWKYLLVIGYVIPLTVVGVSVGLFAEGYGSEQCWIKTDRDFVWSFLGPVCFILTLNLILFMAIIITLRTTMAGLNSEHSKIKEIKILLFKTLVQFVILGCPWVLGFFTKGSKVLEIIFLFLNSQQGTFIYLVHCVLNQETL